MASILYKLEPLYRHFPEVKAPGRHVNLKEKFIWVGIALLLFFIMAQITPIGAARPDQSRLDIMQIVFASELGTLMSIGIGPIVTASIILQLLVGAKMINLDLHNPDDRAVFQGTQKLLTILVSLFEAYAFVSVGAIPLAAPGNVGVMILVTLQIAFASVLLMFLDEMVSKWGIGSGIGLFIAAGVSQSIIVRAFSIVPTGAGGLAGIVPNFLTQLAGGQLNLLLLWPLLMTVVIFLIVAYLESLKIEIPLSYGRFGIGARYPLKFFYTSNIPVILASAVLANVVLFAGLFAGMGAPILGQVENGQIIENIEKGGVGYLITQNGLYGVLNPDQIQKLGASETFFDTRTLITCDGIIDPGQKLCINQASGSSLPISCPGSIRQTTSGNTVEYYCSTGGIGIPSTVLHMIIYSIVFISFCVLFGAFWVMMSGMDAATVSEQMESSGLQIPGFRADKRVIQRVLERYIPQLTIVSAVFVGMVAVLADFTGALGTGTGILLTVGILYRMYEEIKKEQLNELSPALRKFMGAR